jgi:FkbM family methyltransferase
LVNRNWGPRGFTASFRKLAAQGIAPTVIVDAGASDGKWSLECSEVFPQAKYLLVDPLPANQPRLELLCREHSNFRFWSGALGSANGTMNLKAHGDQSSFLASEYAGSAGSTSHNVEVRTLDSLVAEGISAAPNLLKADVQGYEREVLAGATNSLATIEVLLIELSFRRLYQGGALAHEVIADLGNRGFRIYDLCTYAQRPRDGELAQADVVFVRDGSKVFACETWS